MASAFAEIRLVTGVRYGSARTALAVTGRGVPPFQGGEPRNGVTGS
jgi:hypothetical protein